MLIYCRHGVPLTTNNNNNSNKNIDIEIYL